MAVTHNTLANKQQFESSSDFQIKAAPHHQPNQNLDEVFFIVNVKELFNIDLNYPGIIAALNKAYAVSREYTPYDSGVTYRSYTIVKLDNERVKVFYDPSKVVGATRYGKTVTQYYPAFIAEHASRFNWLSIVIKHFYDTLFSEVMKLKQKADAEEAKANEAIADADTIEETSQPLRRGGLWLAPGLLFLEQLHEEYKRKKEEAQAKREQERKMREERRKQYKALKKRAKEAKKKRKEINTEDE